MRRINANAKRVLEKLTADIEVGDARTFDAAPGAFMAVHVDRLDANLFAVAHRYEVNGDMVPDPDVEFFRGADGEWYPTAIDQSGAVGGYRRHVEIENGQPVRFSPRGQADLAVFCGMWLRNIKRQQGL